MTDSCGAGGRGAQGGDGVPQGHGDGSGDRGAGGDLEDRSGAGGREEPNGARGTRDEVKSESVVLRRVQVDDRPRWS